MERNRSKSGCISWQDFLLSTGRPDVWRSLIAAIAGDIAGSIYERRGTRIKTKDFPLFSGKCHPTDDTLMSIAVANALCTAYAENDDPSDEAVRNAVVAEMRRIGSLYPDAGYGAAFQKWISNPVPYGSWGNGSAMRVSYVGHIAKSAEEALHLAELTADVSHNDPEGIKGAQAVALAVYLVRCGADKETVRMELADRFGYNLSRTVDEIRPEYKFDASCPGSVPEAIIAFLDSTSYEDAVRNAVSLGGDADTQACIAGAIAGVYYGMPEGIASEAFGYLCRYCRADVLA